MCPAYQELAPVVHLHNKQIKLSKPTFYTKEKRGEQLVDYQVGKYEAPVETLPISSHRSKF